MISLQSARSSLQSARSSDQEAVTRFQLPSRLLRRVPRSFSGLIH